MLFHAPLVLALLLQSQTVTTPVPSALIVGRVVDAESGAPIAGAILLVSGSSLPPAPGSPAPRVMTSAQGQFVIRGLQHGGVNLNVTKPGYLMATYGQLRPRGPSRSVEIDADDAHVTDVVVKMWKFGSISGTVVDEAGEPIGGVGVQAYERTYEAGQGRFGGALIGANTDDRGIYTIGNLPPGDYVVGVVSTTSAVPTGTIERVRSQATQVGPLPDDMRMFFTAGLSLAKPGTPYAIGIGNFSVSESSTLGLGLGSIPILEPDGSLLVYQSVFYPEAPHFDDATAIAIKSGEDRTGIDLALHLARGVRVSGTIVSPDGSSANLGVQLSVTGNNDTVFPIDAATGLTDANGGFTLFGVTPGQYTLRVTHIPSTPGPGPEVTTVMSSGSGGMITAFSAFGGGAGPVPTAPTLSANMPVAVGNTDIAGLLVPLKSGGRITGHLEFDGTADQPTGGALSSIRTVAQSADGSRVQRLGAMAMEGHADDTGTFTTVGMVPGRYVLQVDGIPSPWVVRSAMYRGQDLLDSAVAIESGDISGVVITLTDRTQNIRGTVRIGPAPDPNATVFLFPQDVTNSPAAGPAPRRFRGVRTGADGSYAFNNVPPGAYDIVAVTNDPGEGWQNPAVLASLAALATPLQVTDGEAKTQDLASATIK